VIKIFRGKIWLEIEALNQEFHDFSGRESPLKESGEEERILKPQNQPDEGHFRIAGV
jgi:hypothetical protein